MNAHQRRIARRRGELPSHTYIRSSTLFILDLPPIHGRADAEALYGVGSDWAEVAERFENRHRDVEVFTLDPMRPTRPLFEEGIRNAVTRSGFE